MKILVTGFNGFSGHDLNPSWEMLRPIPETYGEHQIIKRQVRTEYADSGLGVLAAMREHQPDLVICFGLRGSRGTFDVESVGCNYGGTFADNAGVVKDGFLDPSASAPVGAVPTINPDLAAGWLSDAPIPSGVSTTAGDYLCNQLLYTVGRACATGGEFAGTPFVFTHVMADEYDTQFGVSYRKRSISDLAQSAAAMIRGAARDVLGVPVVEGWGPVAPPVGVGPQIANPPRSYFHQSTSTGDFIVRVFAALDGDAHGLPTVDDFPEGQYIYPESLSSVGWDEDKTVFSAVGRLSFRVVRESDGQEVSLTPGPGLSEVGLFLGRWDQYYPGKLLIFAQIKPSESDWSQEPHIIEISGEDTLGSPFTTRMRVSFEGGDPGTYTVIE